MSLTDKNELISGSLDKSIRLWDLKSNKSVRLFKGHSNWVQCLVQLNSHELISGSWDKTIKFWDMKTGRCLKTLEEHKGTINSLTVLADVSLLVSVSTENDEAKLWDLNTGKCKCT